MNALLDGIQVGHATDFARQSGSTSILFDTPAVCAVAVQGGAPGTRETDALQPGNLNPPVDAVVLSGGSAFGLAAADGAQRALADLGRGYSAAGRVIPIVPAAIVFDLKAPGLSDYAALGRESVAAASSDWPLEGSIGAGAGATTATLKGGFGAAVEASSVGRITAFAVTNCVGSAVARDGPWFHAARFGRDGELGPVAPQDADLVSITTKLGVGERESTVIAAIVTEAALDISAAHRLARASHDGIAAAVWPSHTRFDGDTIFAASTGKVSGPATPQDWISLEAAAVRALARAVARGVRFATANPVYDQPAWQDVWGKQVSF